MNDAVVGFITGYNFSKIKNWVNSLDRCGFNGDKYMVCYDIDSNVITELKARGYKVFTGTLNAQQNIVLQRFHDLWHIFKNIHQVEHRYLITTDVKDVIFQNNPSNWLEKNLGTKLINIGCESIRYRDEPWGNNNLQASFGTNIYSQLKDSLIGNAGTISGEFNTMLDFALQIYLICGRSPIYVPGGGGPDQAALNVLINSAPYRNITNLAMSETGYAAQLGTTGPQVADRFGHVLVEPSPVLDESGVVCTSSGTPFSIVHQYDRVPKWKEIIERKYE